MNGQPSGRPRSAGRRQIFTDSEIEEAKTNIQLAFSLAGLVAGSHLVCPSCGKTGPNRVKLYADGGWHCFSSNWCHSSGNRAVAVLTDSGWGFRDAVSALLGRRHSKPRNAPERPKPVDVAVSSFKAAVDTEVYEALWEMSDADAAAEYYGRWHVSSEAVAEARCAVVPDFADASAKLLSRFGRDRLVSCGLLSPGEPPRKDYWVVNQDYPVLEPHLSADGRIVGLQARPSYERARLVAAHKAYVRERNEAEASGREMRDPTYAEKYRPPFSSLRGGTADHLVGIGVPRLAALDHGSAVYLAEGAKDAMAGWTMGIDAYGVPGASVRIPRSVLAVLRRMDVRVAFDGDSGGDEGAERLLGQLAAAGIVPLRIEPAGVEPWIREKAPYAEEGRIPALMAAAEARRSLGLDCRRARPPDGMDLADVLADAVSR